MGWRYRSCETTYPTGDGPGCLCEISQASIVSHDNLMFASACRSFLVEENCSELKYEKEARVLSFSGHGLICRKQVMNLFVLFRKQVMTYQKSRQMQEIFFIRIGPNSCTFLMI